MGKELHIFEKSVIITLLDDDPKFCSAFISDVEAQYYAPEITYLFQNFSQLLLDIIVGVAAAYVYNALQKKDDLNSKKELLESIKTTLIKYNKEIKNRIKHIEDKIAVLDKLDVPMTSIEAKARGISEKEVKKKLADRKVRLNKYKMIAKKLQPKKDNIKYLIQILDAEYKRGYEASQKHYNSFQSIKELAKAKTNTKSKQS